MFLTKLNTIWFCALLIAITSAEQSCYVSKTGFDVSSCGNATAACSTIAQCLENNPSNILQIAIYPGYYTGLGYCNLTIRSYVSIESSGGDVTIDCKNESLHFIVTSAANHTSMFTGINFVNGFGLNGGSLHIQNSDEKSWVEIVNCNFLNNNATTGGAIYSNDTSVQVLNSKFANNSAVNGGAIHAQMIEARDSIFENNIASHGGAIYATAGTGITNSTFMYNVATRSGGAVYIFTGQPVPYAYVMHSRLEGNTAGDMGGAIFQRGWQNITTEVQYEDLVVTGNIANKGGAFAVSPIGPQIYYTWESSTMFNNSAHFGGALWVFTKNTDFENMFHSVKIESNYAQVGSAIYLNSTNDQNTKTFEIRSPYLINNNIECSDPSMPFCNSCKAKKCSLCIGTCTATKDTDTTFSCNSVYNEIRCMNNGTCAYEETYYPTCKCADDWTGTLCQTADTKHDAAAIWITVAVIALIIVVVTLGTLANSIRRKQRSMSTTEPLLRE